MKKIIIAVAVILLVATPFFVKGNKKQDGNKQRKQNK